MTTTRTFNPGELAGLLGLPRPTEEQARVIAADTRPRVVVAGAGSGKSETVAARVVWLVANGHVRPERVLGLTFTRKAATELATRVRTRLGQLRDAGVVAGETLDGEPTVSTYHSYAARLVADHALREAREPTMRLITPAVQWQLAAKAVSTYDGPMDDVGWGPETVIAAVLALAGELGEHMCGPDDVRAVGDRLRRGAEEQPGRLPAAVTRLLARQRAREQLLPLVGRYEAEKATREVMDHSDQVSLAARIARRHPEVGAMERSRYAVVLLDEYQDTGYAQLVLLRSLFSGEHENEGRGHPVMAVGDPCQSIYGWRGAAAGNLRRFPHDFLPRDGVPAEPAALSQSFRNGERVLDTAARLSVELRDYAGDIPRLRPGPNRAGRGRVECGLFESAEAEAEWLAGRVRQVLDGSGPGAEDAAVRPGDVAVLARKRAQFPALRRALEEVGIPVEVVGLGGLLTVPEVQDVVATLRVLHDPTAGDALARLLTGPRWRIGPRDLVALGRRARELARSAARDVDAAGDIEDSTGEAGDPVEEAVADMTAAEDVSLVDALDDLGERDAYSKAGYARLAALAGELRSLRGRVGQALPDLVTDIERTLGLDIEVASRPGADPVTARADLDAFADAAARFAGDRDEPTLGAFLAYLAAAQDQEFGLETGPVGEADAVKLMTVHAAKGLEWAVVAVPGLSAGKTAQVFPAKPQASTKWTDNPRKLPFSLRGDRTELPELTEITKEGYERFAEACTRREELEERRLAYVAATRAASLLLCSGYWWGDGKRPLGPSVFLREIHESCSAGAGDVAEWAPEPPDDAENPALSVPETAPWPDDPRGPRHDEVAAGAALVERALAEERTDGEVGTEPAGDRAPVSEADSRRAAGWALDERLLLAERDHAAGRDRLAVELPEQLSVSALVTLARDREELARQIRRPMPRPPAPRARRGTAFHRWLESRYGQQRLIDPDDVPGSADEEAAPDEQLAELRRCFLASAWAERTPVDVEVPFEQVVGDRLIRGRMDAVFADGDGGYDVVDWKTGKPPRGREADVVAVQLAAYRLAWAELVGVPVERVRAAFHYVRDNETVRPVDLLDEYGLADLMRSVPEAAPGSR